MGHVHHVWGAQFFSYLLQVVTLVGEPFVFIKALPESGRCEDLDDAQKKKRHIKCSGKVYGEHTKLVATDKDDHCCYGKPGWVIQAKKYISAYTCV